MTSRRLALALVFFVVAAPVGVGAATPGVSVAGAAETPTTPGGDNASAAAPMGDTISSMMQASAAQAAGTVENGMWEAAYANATNASEKRALVEQRYGQLNTTVAELKAERAALQERFRNGTINRTTYLAQLSAIVGRLAALDEGIEEAGERGAAVGANRSRIDELRSQARDLGGAEVSRLARNLTGGQGGPGPSGLFDGGPPGQSGERGPGNASNRTTAGGPGGAQGNAGNATRGGNTTRSAGGQGPPSSPGGQSGGNATATETPTPTDG